MRRSAWTMAAVLLVAGPAAAQNDQAAPGQAAQTSAALYAGLTLQQKTMFDFLAITPTGLGRAQS